MMKSGKVPNTELLGPVPRESRLITLLVIDVLTNQEAQIELPIKVSKVFIWVSLQKMPIESLAM